MNRWEQLRLSIAISIVVFFIQVVLLVVNVQFVDEATGQFRLGANFRFKFVDETSRQFVLVSQLQKLPEELLLVLEISIVVAAVCYAVLGLYFHHRPLGAPAKKRTDVGPGDSVEKSP